MLSTIKKIDSYENKISTTALVLCYTSFNILATVSADARYGKPSDFNGRRPGSIGVLILALIIIAT